MNRFRHPQKKTIIEYNHFKPSELNDNDMDSLGIEGSGTIRVRDEERYHTSLINGHFSNLEISVEGAKSCINGITIESFVEQI